MPNWCENKITITPVLGKNGKATKKAKEQMVLFIEKLSVETEKEEKSLFSIFFPTPESLKITSGSATDFCLVVLKSQEGDHAEIDRINQYPWAKEFTREQLIAHIIEGNSSGMTDAKKALENEKIYGCRSWYEWNVQNWGTKWDMNIYHSSLDDDEIILEGDTAWSPPLAGLIKISKDFNKLNFTIEYVELGVGFQGTAEISNGDCDDCCGEYEYSDYEMDDNEENLDLDGIIKELKEKEEEDNKEE